MADDSYAPNFAHELNDDLNSIEATLNDLHDFVADSARYMQSLAALERQHADGLRALLKKAISKRNDVAVPLAVGRSPAKSYRDGERLHSIVSTWSRILASAEETAQSRMSLASSMDSIAQNLIMTSDKIQHLLRSHHSFARSKVYANFQNCEDECQKLKTKYDDACANLEQARSKQEGAKDEEKAQRQFALARVDMEIAKNSYLVSIPVANTVKAQYFRRDLPELQSHYQLLWTSLINIWQQDLKSFFSCIQSHQEQLSVINGKNVESAEMIDAAADQQIYIDYNKRAFFEPADRKFEPCGLWHDNASLVLDGEAKVYLQNVLAKSRKGLESIPSLPNKDEEASRLLQLLNSRDAAGGDRIPNLIQFLSVYSQSKLQQLEQDQNQVEINLTLSVLGDDVGLQKPHSMKTTVFAKPTECAVCSHSIWGIRGKGMTCKACGISCHVKCENKLASNCARSQTASSSFRRTDSIASQASFQSSTVESPSAATTTNFTGPIVGSSASYETCRAVYDFEASTTAELSITSGEKLKIISGDDQGWTRVRRDGNEEEGLVPTTYLSDKEMYSLGMHGETTRIIAEYTAEEANERSVRQGDLVQVLTRNDSGWAKILDGSGSCGLVPAWCIE